MFNNFGGIADGDRVRGDVVRDDRTGSYGTIIADGDALFFDFGCKVTTFLRHMQGKK